MMPWLFDLQLFSEEKTEPATPKKKREAREKGQVARSQELSSALVLLVAVFFVFRVMPKSGSSFLDFATNHWQNLYRGELTITVASHWLWQIAIYAAQILLPLFALVFTVGLVSSALQVGFMLSGAPLSPSLQKINPLEGFKRMFSKRSLMELVKSLLKLFGVALIVYQSADSTLGWSLRNVGQHTILSIGDLSQLIYSTTLKAVTFLLLVGAIDYIYQRFDFDKNLKMSKKEIKEEHKQAEGDPQLRARMRERQRMLARSRMMHEVPKADVIIVNPVRLAIALKYSPDEADAPLVVAKGQGYVALKIREVADEHKTTIVENKPLAQALFPAVDIGQEIPPEFYQAVAEVLAFVFRVARRSR